RGFSMRTATYDQVYSRMRAEANTRTRRLRDNTSAGNSGRVRTCYAADPAVRAQDRLPRAVKRLPDNSRDDALRAETDDKIDRASACKLRPSIWGLADDRARPGRGELARDARQCTAVSADRCACVSPLLPDNLRDAAEGIDEGLEGEVKRRVRE